MSGYREPWPLGRALRHPVFWGGLGSVLVLALVTWAGLQEKCGITGSCESRFAQLWEAAPHEIAQSFGAVAMALAVVWLVVLVWVLSRIAAGKGRGNGDA